MIRAAADERGFTLTELLVAMSVGIVVLLALMMVSANVFSGAAHVTDRTETSQRGRALLDHIVTRLSSQVCLDSVNVPIVSGDGTSVTFYADLGDESFRPQRFRYTFDETARTVREEVFDSSGTPPNITFAGSASSDRILARHIAADPSNPFFRYYGYNGASPAQLVQLATPLAGEDLRRAVQVAVAFKALAERTKTGDRRSTTIRGDAFVASLEPTVDAAAGARCQG